MNWFNYILLVGGLAGLTAGLIGAIPPPSILMGGFLLFFSNFMEEYPDGKKTKSKG